MAMTKAAANSGEEYNIVDAEQERAEGVQKEKEGRNMACNEERVVEDSGQQCSESNSDIAEEGRRRTTTAAATDSTTSGKERSSTASATPQREQRADASSEEEEMDGLNGRRMLDDQSELPLSDCPGGSTLTTLHGRFVPLSRSR